MSNHEKINYVEFPTTNTEATKSFFGEVFDWTFEDFGSEYVAFYGAGIDGGFFQSDLVVSAKNGSALIIFYSLNLQQTQDKILAASGELLQPIFEFPGGRRFHFADPNGNEFAVWSDR